jgi:membrane-associated phospholipid phosphatase
MKFRLLMVPALAAGLLLSPHAAYASDKDWQTVSDVGAYSLMAFSIGLPVVKKDKHGVFQASGALIATSVVTEGLKEAFPKTRPDGSDRKSFPSGHTSRSFSSAATIFNRYGPSYGVPAFAVASLVGVARVQGNKHFWTDVIAGAALGTATGLLITHKQVTDPKTAFIPWGDTKSLGMTIVSRF